MSVNSLWKIIIKTSQHHNVDNGNNFDFTLAALQYFYVYISKKLKQLFIAGYSGRQQYLIQLKRKNKNQPLPITNN